MFSMELQELAHCVRDVLDDSCISPLHTGDPDLDVALATVSQSQRNNEARGALLRPFWVIENTSVDAEHVNRR